MPFVAYLLCNLSLSLHEQLDLRPTLKQLAADEVRTLQEPLSPFGLGRTRQEDQ